MNNPELLEKTLDYIRMYREEHDQGVWYKRNSCGTVACFAGHTCLQAGLEVGTCQTITTPGRYRYEHVSEVAKNLLGLVGDERSRLFAAYDFDEVELVVKNMLNEYYS